MGSEMCIRDSITAVYGRIQPYTAVYSRMRPYTAVHGMECHGVAAGPYLGSPEVDFDLFPGLPSGSRCSYRLPRDFLCILDWSTASNQASDSSFGPRINFDVQFVHFCGNYPASYGVIHTPWDLLVIVRCIRASAVRQQKSIPAWPNGW